MLNLFQHLWKGGTWTLKQVQGDEVGGGGTILGNCHQRRAAPQGRPAAAAYCGVAKAADAAAGA